MIHCIILKYWNTWTQNINNVMVLDWYLCVNLGPWLTMGGVNSKLTHLSMTMMKTNFEIAKIMVTFLNNRDNGNYDIILEITLLKSPQLSLHPHIYSDTSWYSAYGPLSNILNPIHYMCNTWDMVLNVVLTLWIRIDLHLNCHGH